MQRFNPRPRRGGDPLTLRHIGGHEEFQSTPPQGGRHAGLRDSWLVVMVSIHAPAGGATRHVTDGPVNRVVSIHAPAGGATWK